MKFLGFSVRTISRIVRIWQQALNSFAVTVWASMNPGLNLVGPQVRKWRAKLGWSRETLARKLQLLGWSISRNSLAKLELQLRRVPDCEVFLGKVLGAEIKDLFPKRLPLKEIGPAFQSGDHLAIFPTRGEKG